MAELIRIQKAIASAGLMSRRAAEEAIAAGRVGLDGETAKLGDRVDVETQTLTLDGVPVPIRPDLETHLLYKPAGVISTASDPQGRPTVVDMVRSGKRLFPVGRLDQDSEGLILVTNDGELADLLTHPRYGVTKTYLAVVAGDFPKGKTRDLVEGVALDDGPARAVAARIVDRAPGRTMVEVVMEEGRKREVRRMFSALGHEVTSLVRIAIGPLSDRNLRPGQSRRLTAAELRALYRAAGRR